ncbi:D-mandelate dehydrogenase [Purpureocillium lavendulum]|uniref:D-mandelate dehydrogenase n=1 Tax=Purpureocillium lavendulum TaxID=1247861 RepID=A0AB34FMT7_9HYPO|nr:D-mandelate dehydrogenase [Purpureocillium lavendulum]
MSAMEAFEAELAKATNLGKEDLLGAVAMVIDNNGNFLYRHAAGRQLLDADSPHLDPDCTISLTSAGKFFTNIAALQLVERGIVVLDEPISKHLPEIEKCLLVEEVDKEIQLRSPIRGVTLRDLLLSTSGMGTSDTYKERFGSDIRVPPPDFANDAHPLVKNQFTHLFFEPGEGFEYGCGIYCVQLLVERLGDKDRFFQPALVPHVWKRRLQMVERKVDASTPDGKVSLVARDKDTYGLTCSVSDLARLFGDIMSPDCKLLQRQEHRDLLFTPQLTPGSPAHQSLLAETTNYGFLLPLYQDVSHTVSWALTPPPAINWTVAGALVEEDGTLPGSGIPKGTVAFEGQPNIIWTMNREKGRMMLFGTQLLPGYDVKAHNLGVRFLSSSDMENTSPSAFPQEVAQETAIIGNETKLYVSGEYHVVHCIYMWRKLHRGL